MVQLLILDGFKAKYSPSIAPLDTLPPPQPIPIHRYIESLENT